MELRSKLLKSALFGAAAGAFALGMASISHAGDVRVLSANESTCGLYGSHIGDALGVYEEGGIAVQMLSSETTVPYVAFISNGDAELTMLDSAQVYQMANANQPGAVIFEVMQFAPEGIYVLADGPVNGLADLRGQTIGLASDRDQITTIIAMDFMGETLDSMEISTVVVGDSGPVMANALTQGQVAAFAGGSADRRTLAAAGVATRDITPTAVSQNVGNSYALWKPRMEELRGDVSVFLKGLAMGNHAGIMDPKAVASICRVVLPEEWEVEEAGFNMLNYAVNTLNMRRTKNWGEPQPDVWAAVQAPYIKLGEIDGFIEPNRFLDYSFIEAANAWTTADLKARLAAWKAEHEDALFQ
jgi:NitT/TauT family transport system substrate-binding protein